MHADAPAHLPIGPTAADLRPRWRELALGTVVAVALISMIGAGIHLRSDPAHPLSTQTINVLLTASTLAWAAGALLPVLVRHRSAPLAFRSLGMITTSRRWLLTGLAAGVLLRLVIVLNAILGDALRDEPFDRSDLTSLPFEAGAGLSLVLFLAVAAVTAPLFEEMFFRGLAHAALSSHLPPVLAGVISAAMFAGAHGVVADLWVLFSVGFAAAYIYDLSGSLWPAIAAHVTFNLSAVCLTLVLQAASP